MSNIIDAAKKRIEENNERVRLLAIREKSLNNWITSLENDIFRHKKPVDELEAELHDVKNSLKETEDEKYILFVDNLALQKLIADPRWVD